jgi:hypothetical protein
LVDLALILSIASRAAGWRMVISLEPDDFSATFKEI